MPEVFPRADSAKKKKEKIPHPIPPERITRDASWSQKCALKYVQLGKKEELPRKGGGEKKKLLEAKRTYLEPKNEPASW